MKVQAKRKLRVPGDSPGAMQKMIIALAAKDTEVVTSGIVFIIDGGGSEITEGEKGHLSIPFNCQVLAVELEADQSGDIEIDIWKDTLANFPPTVADSICSASLPTLTTAQYSFDSTLTNWTSNISRFDILAFNVNSVTDVTRVTLTLHVKRT